jgi:hypothetical protein
MTSISHERRILFGNGGSGFPLIGEACHRCAAHNSLQAGRILGNSLRELPRIPVMHPELFFTPVAKS